MGEKWDRNKVDQKFFEFVKAGKTLEVSEWLSWANVNAVDEFGMTPLHYAVLSGRRDIVELLLKSGADPNKVRRGTGETALHYACAEYEKSRETPESGNARASLTEDRKEIIKLLVKYEAIIKAEDNSGKNPIQMLKDENLKKFLEEKWREGNIILFRRKNQQ